MIAVPDISHKKRSGMAGRLAGIVSFVLALLGQHNGVYEDLRCEGPLMERADSITGQFRKEAFMDEFTKTLIYKRTHRGDPDDQGIFGIHDCMGNVRGWEFDSVIGIGGSAPDPGHEDIAGKVTWIGLGPEIVGSTSRGPLQKFKWFRRFDEIGPELKKLAPSLFAHMFVDRHIRALLSQNLQDAEKEEVKRILRWGEESEDSKLPAALIKKSSSCNCRC